VIRRGLDALLQDAVPGEFEIIVACNGCSDDTAAIARSYGGPVRVVETDVASKVAALNLADSVATGYPRFYIDADIVLSTDDIRKMTTELERGEKLAVSPTMQMDLSRASWPVRAYYQVWTRLPYTRAGMMGVGVYGLSEAGRQRFGEFPDVIADDGYVRVLFADDERGAVPGTVSVVQAPATLAGLIRIKTRSRLGEYQLRERYPERFQQDRKDYSGALRRMLRNPLRWPATGVYLLVNFISRLRAKRQVQSLDTYQWERDTSSRQPAEASAPSPVANKP
ncbi:MAG: glycosyltransferase, partial [Phycisphaeraceae bacterium]